MKHLVLLIGVLILSSCSAENSQSNASSNPASKTTKPAANGPSSQELTLRVEDYEVAPGDQFCIDIKAYGFTNIMSMQYTMNWDPTALTFQKVDNIQLKDLNSNGFGTTRTQEGKLGTAWYDMDVQSISVDDGMTLYQVCFEATGKSGTESRIFFSGDPVTIEVSNKEGEIISLASRRATIRIQ